MKTMMKLSFLEFMHRTIKCKNDLCMFGFFNRIYYCREDVDLTLHASIDALHKNLLSSSVAPENIPENNVTPYDSVSHQGYIEEPEESSYPLNQRHLGMKENQNF